MAKRRLASNRPVVEMPCVDACGERAGTAQAKPGGVVFSARGACTDAALCRTRRVHGRCAVPDTARV